MANPSYYQELSPVTSPVSYQQYVLDVVAYKLGTANPNPKIGASCVIDWKLRDGSNPRTPDLGQLQGHTIAVDNSGNKIRNLSAILVLNDTRFEGSTLVVKGRLGYPGKQNKGNWSVCGGTGKFAGAQGNIAYERVGEGAATTMNLYIRFCCPSFLQPKPVEKVGPWGGEGGTSQEIKDVEKKPPQRIQSISIYASDDVIKSIEFSYIDQAGQTCYNGPWGGHRNKGKPPQTIDLHSETVRKISGSTGKYKGQVVVTSLLIVTNVNNSYAYGKENKIDTPFRVVPENDQSIVGFFGHADEDFVYKIGAYVRTN